MPTGIAVEAAGGGGGEWGWFNITRDPIVDDDAGEIKIHRFRSHYLFEALSFALSTRNEKGGVEEEVGRFRRRWWTPVPQFSTLDELNVCGSDYIRGTPKLSAARSHVGTRRQVLPNRRSKRKEPALPLGRPASVGQPSSASNMRRIAGSFSRGPARVERGVEEGRSAGSDAAVMVWRG